MTNERDATDLLDQAAAQEGVSVAVLRGLLDLEPAFPDLNVYGAKTEFGRRVAEILNQAARAGEAS